MLKLQLTEKVLRRILSVSTIVYCLFPVSAAVIEKVDVETPAGQEIGREIVMSNIQNRPGREFDPQVLSEDIENIYKTGFFTNVEAAVEQREDDKVALQFTIEPVGRLETVNISGNEKLKTKNIRREIDLDTGALLSPEKISDARRAIREYYRSKGYHDIRITTDKSKTEENWTTLEINIEEGKRAKIADVEFIGNTVFSDKKLKRRMRNKPTFWSWFLPVGFYKAEEMHDDKMRIQELYENEGYLDFKINRVEEVYSDDGKKVTLKVYLEEGQPYFVQSVDLEGNKLFGDAELKRLLQLRSLNTFSRRLMARDREALVSRYQPLGYLDVEVRPQRTPNPEEQSVDITYNISEGEPSHIRDVNIRGNVKTQDHVIRRELRLQPGDLANRNKINSSKNALDNLGYFRNVDVTPKSTPESDKKDLDVEVEEQETGQLMVGAGFSSEDDLVGTLQVTQRNFDWKNWPRFTGGGQRMQLSLEVGTVSNNANLRFVEPWWLDRRLRLEWNAFHSERDEGEYDRERTGFGASLAWQWWKMWRKQVGIEIQESTLRDFDDGSSQELLDEKGTYDVVELFFSLSRDSRDRNIHPTRGSKMEFRSEFQPESLGSYEDVYKLNLQASKYYPLLYDFIFKLEGRMGVAENINGGDVAIFDRFFAGGTSTFRGFERREVSPVDVNEDPLGGESLLLGTAELIYPFTDSVRGRLFCDVGNVWTDSYDWQLDEINASVGIGAELRLPIGPIRIDYGIPVKTERDHLDESGRLHFGLSYGF
ncbi:MAG: outer membrane protein assembly factor BamA [Lentisphaeria bacterium]